MEDILAEKRKFDRKWLAGENDEAPLTFFQSFGLTLP